MDPGRLSGRTALVTGGAVRIGRALALALGRHGARVVVHYRSSGEEAAATVAELRELGAEAAAVRGDLADPEGPGAVMAAAAAALGPPDLLVNNASVFAPGDLARTTAAEWDRQQAVNLRAPFLLCREFARALPEDRQGDVVNLNDTRAVRPGLDPSFLAYTISKLGLHGLTRTLALALAPRIRVNELALGAVLPPAGGGHQQVGRDDLPLRRFGDPQEVAGALLFLLTSPTVTGQTLRLDSGRHLV